jgi:predicted amidohydrolase
VAPLRVAGIQCDITWEDRDANLAAYEPKVAAAVAGGARLVVLPEMFAVGFSMRVEAIEEPVDGPTAGWLADQAARHDIWIGGSVPERSDGADRPANVFVLAGPDGTRHRYAKRHTFTYGGESDHFAAGDEAPPVVAVDGVRCSLNVCYDLRFADQFWAQAPDVDAYLVVANWPSSRQAHWSALLVARAIENQAYVVGVNRVGTAGDGTAHSGASVIVDPRGAVVADGGADEAIIVADLDPAEVAAVRTRFPFVADR